MTRHIDMDTFGNFQVSDDPDDVIATALLVATNNVNAPSILERLATDGDGRGVRTETFGSIHRAWSREELPPPFDEDMSIDPETHELWVLFKEPNKRKGIPGQYVVMHGDELRDLVKRALALRQR
jgi:hypothetical protein